MSSNGCCKAETGSLIFGVISAVFTGLLSILNIVLLVGINCYAGQARDIYVFHHQFFDPDVVMISANIFYGIITLKFLVDFLFAVLLCDGVCKKKPCHVRAYFIYGVVMAVLSGLFVIGFFFLDLSAGLITLALLAIYCLILHMVNVAYSNINSGEVYQFQHKRLVETVY